MDKLNFLAGEEPGQAEEPCAQAVVAEETPPRPEPAPPPLAAIEPGHVPISAMLDEREKRQALERRLAQIEARPPPAPPPPLEAQIEERLHAQNLRSSRRFAESQYGAERVARLHDWASARCDSDPAFNQQMRSSDHPYEEAKRAFDREQIIAEVGDADLDAFRAWKSAQAEARALAEAHTPSPASPPPRSLVTASGDGALGHSSVSVGDGRAFEALFKG